LEEQYPIEAFDGRVFLHEKGTVTLASGEKVEADHTYVVDGALGYTSVTTVLGTMMEKFDALRISTEMVHRTNWPSRTEYYAQATDAANAKLREAWRATTYEGDVRSWANDDLQKAAELFVRGDISFDTLCIVVEREQSSSYTGGKRVHADVKALREQFLYFAAEYVRGTWTAAADHGTENHERLELFFRPECTDMTRARLEQLRDKDAPELSQFLRWYDEWLEPRNYAPYRMEVRVCDRELKMAGSIDALFIHRDTRDVIMVDWKFSKGIDNMGHDRVALAEPNDDGCLFEWRESRRGVPPYAKPCTGALSGYYSCNYTKYCMQQQLYKMMLERNSDVRVSRLYLLIMHPKQGGNRYDLMPVEYNEQLVADFRAYRIAMLHAQEPSAT